MGNDTNALLQPTQEQDSGSLQEAANEACFAHFAVVIEYREQEQITELLMKKDLLPLILDTEEDTKNPQTVAGTEIRVGSGHFEA